MDYNIIKSTNRPYVPHSRVGWIKPVIEEHLHDFAKNPSLSFEKTNLRGYVAQVDLSIWFNFFDRNNFLVEFI